MSKPLSTELVAIADYAMNADDKKLSIIGIFDKVFVRSFPAPQARLFFIVTFNGTPNEEHELTLKIISPSKKEEFSAKVLVKPGENGKFNFVSNFEGFPLQEAGSYSFVFEKQGKAIVNHSIDVVLLKEPDKKQVAN